VQVLLQITDSRKPDLMQVNLHKDHSPLQIRDKEAQEVHLTMTETEDKHSISL
jgi:hypothetical protein